MFDRPPPARVPHKEMGLPCFPLLDSGTESTRESRPDHGYTSSRIWDR